MASFNLMQIGAVIVMIGLLVVVIGAFRTAKDPNTESKIAVGGFIGPLPFGFADDKSMMYFLIGIMSFAMVIWFVLMSSK